MSQADKSSYYQIAGIHGRPFVAWDGVSFTPGTDRGILYPRYPALPNVASPILGSLRADPLWHRARHYQWDDARQSDLPCRCKDLPSSLLELQRKEVQYTHLSLKAYGTAPTRGWTSRCLAERSESETRCINTRFIPCQVQISQITRRVCSSSHDKSSS